MKALPLAEKEKTEGEASSVRLEWCVCVCVLCSQFTFKILTRHCIGKAEWNVAYESSFVERI